MNKLATVHERRGFLLIQTALQTEQGLWIGTGPCAKLPASVSSAEIGAAMLEALARSGAIIPHPTDWTETEPDPVLQQAGVKNWAAFARGAKVVEVALETEIELTPTRNVGRGGFEHLPDESNSRRNPGFNSNGKALKPPRGSMISSCSNLECRTARNFWPPLTASPRAERRVSSSARLMCVWAPRSWRRPDSAF
jgi:hypothetical protein